MNLDRPKSFFDLVGYAPKPMVAEEIHGTTVLSIKYNGGVVTLADRLATMGNLVMYDQAEKLFALDDSTVIAISGSFARSIEICRLLKHSFKYYRRMHLQEMSLDGKLQEISKALSQNLGMAMNGIGVFIPILAAYDPKHQRFGVYSFDTAGARFELGDHASAGSGSERIRGIFDYVANQSGPWHLRKRDDVLVDALRMLLIAADLDSATGGLAKHPPIVRDLTADGNQLIEGKELEVLIARARKSKSE